MLALVRVPQRVGHDPAAADAVVVRAVQMAVQPQVGPGQQIVQRQLQVAPTLTIRPGYPVRVIVTRDLVLEPYRN